MTVLTVIVPTRGRPAAALELMRSFRETCTAATTLVLAVDADDPALDAYRPIAMRPGVELFVAPGLSNMVTTLNAAATFYADRSSALAFMGDDHRPVTVGWDRQYVAALRRLGTGMVYGNDLLQGENIPTQIAMTSDIVQALGWMSPPTLVHLAVDNWWKALGEGAGCLQYMPEVVIEHLHPFAGKAPMDEGYHRVNAPSMYHRDLAEFARLEAEELPAAIVKVRALREKP